MNRMKPFFDLQTTIKIQSKSINKDKTESQKQGVSISTQKQARDLMTVDEIRRMDNNKEILLVRGLKPILAEKAWYFKYHPKRQIADSFTIADITEMPVPESIPYRFFDVQQHIIERKRKAQEVLKARSKEVDIDTSSFSGLNNNDSDSSKKTYANKDNLNSNVNQDKPIAEGLGKLSYNDLYENSDVDPISHVEDKRETKNNDDFDLQSELESKFDKLFGKANKNNN